MTASNTKRLLGVVNPEIEKKSAPSVQDAKFGSTRNFQQKRRTSRTDKVMFGINIEKQCSS